MANSDHMVWIREGVNAWNARREQSEFTPDFDGANIPAILQGVLYSPTSLHIGTSLEGINLSGALLRNASLSGLNLRGADLELARLEGSSLVSTDLREATLTLANLSGTILLTAKLNGAKAGGADFRGANLSGAYLDDADFTHADLADANLVRSSMERAQMQRAVLVNADLTSAEPWKAILYDHSDLKIADDSHLPDRVKGVGELMTIVDRLTQHYDSPITDGDIQAPLLYYRGEALHTWELRPSSTRTPSAKQPDVRGREGEILLDLMSRRPEEFSQMRSALSEWVLAQHYGLKTRLLDVTRNPLVALFSACDDSRDQSNFTDKDGVLHVFAVPRDLVKSFTSDSVSVVTNFAKLSLFDQLLLLGKSDQSIDEDMKTLGQESPVRKNYSEALIRLYHNIGREKPHFKERIDPRDFYKVFVVEPEQSLDRVRAQSAAFLMSAFHQRFEPSHILEWNSDIPIYEHHRFRIPAKCKQSILRELRLLDVTRETLFPGLEEAAQAVMREHGRVRCQEDIRGAEGVAHTNDDTAGRQGGVHQPGVGSESDGGRGGALN